MTENPNINLQASFIDTHFRMRNNSCILLQHEQFIIISSTNNVIHTWPFSSMLSYCLAPFPDQTSRSGQNLVLGKTRLCEDCFSLVLGKVGIWSDVYESGGLVGRSRSLVCLRDQVEAVLVNCSRKIYEGGRTAPLSRRLLWPWVYISRCEGHWVHLQTN